MNFNKHFFIFIFFSFFYWNCSPDRISTSKAGVSQPGGLGNISTSFVGVVTYNNLFALNAQFKEENVLQSTISFSNIELANNSRVELVEDWLIAGDSLPFSRLLEFVGGDVILQSYKSASNSHIEVTNNIEGEVRVTFDTLLYLKDIRFQNNPQSSDSILLVDGFFEIRLDN